MEITGFKSEEELNELLDAGKITKLTYVTKQSVELSKEFEDFCSDRDLEKDDESAELFMGFRQQLFEEAFKEQEI